MVKRLLPQGEFARNVLTVMSGTTLAQAIPVLISPVLTRLYTPAELGALALYVSTLAVAAVVATGRFELAVLIPRRDREAVDVATLGVALAGIVCVLAWIGLAAYAVLGPGGAGSSTPLDAWLYVLPLSTLLMGLYQCLTYWNNRRKRFAALGAGKVGQSAAMSSVQIGAGLAGSGAGGLIAGYLVGQLAANTILLRRTLGDAEGAPKLPSFVRAVAVARRHANFPRYMIPGQLANVASSQMPVLLMSFLYGPAVAGLYSLAERVLVLPSSIIGSAVGDVYRQRAAEVYNDQGNCRALYVQTAKRLALMGAGPLLLVGVAAPWIFETVFGPAWRGAGEIASLLCVMVFFQVVSSPLSQTVLLANMHRLDMLWQFARLALSAGSLYLGYALWGSAQASVALFAGSFCVLYALHSLMQYRAACGEPVAADKLA